MQPSCPDFHRLWPNIPPNTCTTSNPLCIGESQDVLRRCCSANGTWEEAPTCINYQVTMDEVNPCPNDFFNTGTFCYSVIENTTYPPNCEVGPLLHFEEYIKKIDRKWFPIWMPVERDRSYGYGEKYMFSYR